MADSTISQFVSSGTTAERTAYTPDPPTPASGPDPGYVWWDTDTQTAWAYDFGLADWVELAGGGSGTVTNSGTLTSGAVIVGAGTTVVAATTTGTGVVTAIGQNVTGSGGIVLATSPTLVTPALGTPTALVLTSATGLVTAGINNAQVTLAKIANAAANDKLWGSGNSGSGAAYAEISLGSGLTMTGTTLSASASGGGGLVLLEQHTASSSASLDFTTAISSTYDDYLIDVVGLVASTNTAVINLLVSTDGGSTYETTNYLSTIRVERLGSSAAATLTSVGAVMLLNSYGTGVTRNNLSGHVKMYGPGAALNKLFLYDMVVPSSDGTWYRANGGGVYSSATAVNAFQVKPSTGDLTSGTVRVYGLEK